MRGTKPTVADLPATGNTEGDGWVVDSVPPDRTNVLFVWDEESSQWLDLGGIAGPPGPTGEPGSPGTPGAAGEAGPRGTGWFVGDGPPPADIPGAQPGDLWLDMLTGNVYQLGEELPVPEGIPVGDLPALGQPLEGGYYGGLYSLNGDGVPTHALIVAPRPTGQNTTLAWKNANTAGSGYTSQIDGFTNTEAAAGVGSGVYPVAEWARGLSIDGYSDWFIPSGFELNALYWTLKPEWAGDAPNSAFLGYGDNLYAVPQRGDFGEEDNPTGDQVEGFRFNQPQAFATDAYGVSTQDSDPTRIGSVSFTSGAPFAYQKTSTSVHWRAIRRVAVIP
jgi:hypothetical protein